MLTVFVECVLRSAKEEGEEIPTRTEGATEKHLKTPQGEFIRNFSKDSILNTLLGRLIRCLLCIVSIRYIQR